MRILFGGGGDGGVDICVMWCLYQCLCVSVYVELYAYCDVMVLVEMARAHVCVSRALYDNIVIVRNETCVKQKSHMQIIYIYLGVGIWH